MCVADNIRHIANRSVWVLMETSDNIRTNSDLSITTVRCCTVTNLFLTTFEKIGSLGFTNLASLFVIGRLFMSYALSSNKFLSVKFPLCADHTYLDISAAKSYYAPETPFVVSRQILQKLYLQNFSAYFADSNGI